MISKERRNVLGVDKLRNKKFILYFLSRIWDYDLLVIFLIYKLEVISSV